MKTPCRSSLLFFYPIFFKNVKYSNFNMDQSNDDVFEQIKKQLDDGVYEQIKDFIHYWLTEEQKSLVDKLILDEELKRNYKKYGLCEKCKLPKKSNRWCRCQTKLFQQNFQNWTSGNHIVDKFIQKIQLKATLPRKVIEWIEYDRFENIEYLAKGGFGTTFKAIWKDGSISFYGLDSENNQWKRDKTYKDHPNFPVALKSLHDSQNITADFLNEVSYLSYFNFNSINLSKLSVVHPCRSNHMLLLQV